MPNLLKGSAVLTLLAMFAPPPAAGQNYAWSEVPKFRYNIHGASFNRDTRQVTVVFSITNPQQNNAPYDLATAAPFKYPGATLRVLFAWNTGASNVTELVNTGGQGGEALAPIARFWMTTPPSPGGVGPSSAVNANGLTAQACSAAGSPCRRVANRNVTYWVVRVLPKQAVGSGRVAIEGHPMFPTGYDATGKATYAAIPVKSEFLDFDIDGTAGPRRQVVQFSKCQGCHDGGRHGDVVVPRLALHGGNRNEEPGVCVMCHNPGQTDAAYRSSGAEQAISFGRMVHSIHAGGRRDNPYSVVGFRGTVVDFSHVRFPGDLERCSTCHIDANGQGTHELRNITTLGSTSGSGSVLSIPGSIDVDPTYDSKISPIAAVCSGCHDDRETRDHMVRNGASFGAAQLALQGKEQCVRCHGPGGERDVRRVHED